MSTDIIYLKAEHFWRTPSFVETNCHGQKVKYTPSQIAMNNRRKAGLYCYVEGYKEGAKEVTNLEALREAYERRHLEHVVQIDELTKFLKQVLEEALRTSTTLHEKLAIAEVKRKFNI